MFSDRSTSCPSTFTSHNVASPPKRRRSPVSFCASFFRYQTSSASRSLVSSTVNPSAVATVPKRLTGCHASRLPTAISQPSSNSISLHEVPHPRIPLSLDLAQHRRKIHVFLRADRARRLQDERFSSL